MNSRTIPCLIILLSAQLSSAVADDAKTYPPYQLKRAEVKISSEGYFHNMKKQVRICWFPPHVTEERRVTLKFCLDSKGNVEKSEYVKCSGSKEFDEACTDAIYAESFGDVPKDLGTIVMTYTFVVYVDRKRMDAEKSQEDIIREKAFLGDRADYLDDAEDNLLKNPKSISARLALVRNTLRWTDNEEAIYHLEEGTNLMPNVEIFKKLLNRIKAREILI